MKRIYSLILVLTLIVCLVACGKQEQAKETSNNIVDKESVSQTAEPMETEEPQKQSEVVGDLPIIGLEEPTATQASEGTQAGTAIAVPTDAPTEKPVVKPTEAPTNAPAEEPTEEPTSAPTERPTETPTTEPTESPTEEPTTPTTEAPTEEPTEEPTEAPIELPFVPAF
ncbi:MAG: hypothetical protein J6J44_03940 [Lachnospiraceae bacterium]|nr:hypothetical protein [Lachnospiraceae bacterium]